SPHLPISFPPCLAPLHPRSAFLSPPLFFIAPPTTELYPLSLHDALPISATARPTQPLPAHRSSTRAPSPAARASRIARSASSSRSEEHTSELQSRFDLVCRLLLEKKKHKKKHKQYYKTRTQNKSCLHRTQ